MPPTLIVVSGPPGAGKTTLAHRLAHEFGCPAICRDEIKEGLAHAGARDEIDLHTLRTFFATLALLLGAGVTTIAEAAYRPPVWRPHLVALAPLARLRVIHCTITDEIAATRIHTRAAADRTRRHHPAPPIPPSAFPPLLLDAPTLEVDTTDGYNPELTRVLTFLAKP